MKFFNKNIMKDTTMKPLYFIQATIELQKPANMTDEQCSSLYVHQSADDECISLWTIPFWQRLKFLFHGRLWLGIVSGKSQPPVWIDMRKKMFK